MPSESKRLTSKSATVAKSETAKKTTRKKPAKVNVVVGPLAAAEADTATDTDTATATDTATVTDTATATATDTATATPTATVLDTVRESRSVQTVIGNRFDVVLAGNGELTVRYEDRARYLGSAIQAVVVTPAGVSLVDLVRNGATAVGKTRINPGTAHIALAFTGDGRWDSNSSRNYLVVLEK
ncbi:MAG: hypothetical protein FJZ00_00865 [Candidatus Sericytochromatia bacterium]|uniref:Uncharacterized protein n=1 Tax=Candidatus Tanganyikabacteria bacterium TaxID=2961651 RepID=A0A937X1Q9_9BACT|nr:hypothetical protein [Candidatus Tanganyikabacteria bacterium]